MNEQAVLARRLEQLLTKECKVYKQYISVMADEQAALKNNKIELLREHTAKRAALYQIMMDCQEIRLEVMRSTPNKSKTTLRSWILENFEPQYSRRLLPLANELLETARETKSLGNQHKEIVGFALKALNGVLSLIWSATNNVVKSYTNKGEEKEASNPQNRHSGVLKEA